MIYISILEVFFWYTNGEDFHTYNGSKMSVSHAFNSFGWFICILTVVCFHKKILSFFFLVFFDPENHDFIHNLISMLLLVLLVLLFLFKYTIAVTARYLREKRNYENVDQKNKIVACFQEKVGITLKSHCDALDRFLKRLHTRFLFLSLLFFGSHLVS